MSVGVDGGNDILEVKKRMKNGGRRWREEEKDNCRKEKKRWSGENFLRAFLVVSGFEIFQVGC